MISELYLKKEHPLNSWAYAMFSQLYVGLPFALLNVLAFHSNGWEAVSQYQFILPLSIFAFNWVNDTGAYCTGVLFGKHPLFKRISPKKSWEGSIGGSLSAVVIVGAYLYFVQAAFPYSFSTMLLWTLVFSVGGQLGDLIESAFKRHYGVKDSGKILPGHGGILDRFDSLLFVLPLMHFAGLI